jgi:hypothetical protein
VSAGTIIAAVLVYCMICSPGTVAAPLGGGFVIDGDDGCGSFVDAAEASRSGVTLQIGDRVEFARCLGGAAHDLMLATHRGERHRV